MDWHRFKRWLRILGGGWVVLMGACGGGDKGPTGPGGGGNGGGEDVTGVYEMVGVGQVGLPADVAMEGCTTTRFLTGGLALNDDATWQLTITVEDENGTQELEDEGDFDQNGHKLTFESEKYGDSFEGRVDGDLATIHYDFCANGVPDISFVFAR